MSKAQKITRRAFLKSTAALGAGAMAFGSVRGVLNAAPKKAGEKVWKMKYDCYIMPTAPTAQLDNWMLDRVVEKSKGQIEVEKYWASSLHKVGEHLQAVRDGMSEISMISYGYYPALVPLSRGLEWYYKGCDHSDTLFKVCRDMYAMYKPLRDEWEIKNNSKVLYFTNWDYCPLLMKKPIRKIEDLKGLKIRGYGIGADTMDRLGARGMPIIAAEVYPSLERGILDGVFAYCFITADKAKLCEQAPYVVEIGAGAHAPTAIIMNMDLWKALPTNLKDVFLETVNEIHDWQYLKLYGRLLEETVDNMVKINAKFSKWPAAEIEKARRIVQPAQCDKWIEKVAKPLGFDGVEFQAKVDELIAKYEPEGKLPIPYDIYMKKYG